jgi:acetyl esterase
LADDLTGMPRTHLTVAGFDLLRDEGLAYAQRLETAGVDVDLAFHPGLFHGFANMTGVSRASAAAMGRAAEALKTL